MTTISKKILVVDDEESIREVMKMGLDKLGYPCTLAKNGKEALEILDEEEFSLIITDLKMPEMGGTELCKHIKERNPDTVIYGFYGVVTEDEFNEFEKMGFDGLLCKPVSFKVLKRAIEGAFDKIKRATGTDEI